MEGIHSEVPQCHIESGVEYPLAAEDPIFRNEKYRLYGENLWFDPVPLEMLYTPA